jgi:hypothetical protein
MRVFLMRVAYGKVLRKLPQSAPHPRPRQLGFCKERKAQALQSAQRAERPFTAKQTKQSLQNPRGSSFATICPKSSISQGFG